MLLVDASRGHSPLHEIGLIARERILVGTVVWALKLGFDVVLTEEEFKALSKHSRKQVRHYAYFCLEKRLFALSSDDDRFTNHSDTPNTRVVGDCAVAVRDIEIGEEITCDYHELGWTEFLGVPPRSDKASPTLS